MKVWGILVKVVKYMDDLEKAFENRYSHVHPLIIQRSYEKATSPGDLFDILEGVPSQLPVVWDDVRHAWVHTDDLLQDGGKRGE